MYLRDVMVVPSAVGKEGVFRLRASSDHVLDVLRHHLPKKYVFNDLRRLVLQLGPGRPAIEPIFTNLDGVGMYQIPEFDLPAYFEATQDEQNEIILTLVETAFSTFSRKFGTDPVPLQAAVDAVRACGFHLETDLKCSRTHPGRALRVHVIRRFAPGGVFVRVVVRASKGKVLHDEIVAAGMWVVSVGDAYHSSRWNGDTLEILGISGKQTAEVPCAPFLERIVT